MIKNTGAVLITALSWRMTIKNIGKEIRDIEEHIRYASYCSGLKQEEC